MLSGTLTLRDKSFGHKIDVIHLEFRPPDGAEAKTVDRAIAHDSDGFCEDCMVASSPDRPVFVILCAC